MKKLSFDQIRKIWLDFFASKQHMVLESQSLIPKNDNSLLWINSGVATLKKFFSGVENPPSNRLTNSQKCIRTNDIYNVGVTSRHHTFFEMLGNFSIGDYFRVEAITFAYELLTKHFEIDSKLLYITVYKEDEESYQLWQKLGIEKSHIIKCDKDRNFWEIGQGPCGPCTEIYYDRGPKYDPNNMGEKLFFEDIENDRYIEIWNIVFSEFENDGNNNYTPLIRKNIDTGAGLERLACVSQDVPTNYDIDVFDNVKQEIQKYTENKYNKQLYFEKQKNPIDLLINRAFNVIIDHFKSAIFAISDGALPSNKDRGYIIRKLLRRSFVYFDILKIKNDINEILVKKIIDTMKSYYPELKTNETKIIEAIKQEYKIHNETLNNTINEFKELLQTNKLDEYNLFKLVETYGFPLEIIKEIENSKNESKEMINFIIKAFIKTEINKDNIFSLNKFDYEKFNQHFEEHKKVSKGNKEAIAIVKQNKNIMNLDVESKFDYDVLQIDDAKIVYLYNENFDIVDKLNNENGYVVLDKTCLYATSGGQLNDEGSIDNFNVIDVIKSPNGIHIHKIENATLTLKQIVKVKTNVERRQILTIHHSTEHLLHSALKNQIDESIKQEGALKSPTKVTFDFSYNKKLTLEQILLLEKFIKDIINQNVKSETYLKTLDEALQMGALAYFDDVYRKIKTKLRVVKLCEKSIEICGGTHVKNTSEIQNFKIVKLDSKGSGSWRIEAISSNKLIQDFNENVHKPLLQSLKDLINEYENLKLKNDTFENVKKLDINNLHYFELKNHYDILKNEINLIKYKIEKENNNKAVEELKNTLNSYTNKINLISVKDIDRKTLTTTFTSLLNEKKEHIFIVLNHIENAYQYILCCNQDFAKQKNINLNLLNKVIVEKLNSKGGGKNNFVQGSFSSLNNYDVNELIKEANNLFKW